MRRYKTKVGQQLIYESYERLLASWNVAWAEQDIMTTYGTTHVITAGSPADPVLLLLHGTADNSAMMWVYNIEQLSERFYVIAIDAIGGSGKSEPNERYANEFDQTAWLDELLDAMNHWHYLLKHFNNKSMMKHAITIFTDEQLESIRGKALFLIGEQDILSNYPKAIRKLEQIRLNYKIIRHAGHAINHEQPEKVNRELIEYLLA
ncbi:alpha/beta hydrolase [Paenibacillus thiaminolyticus]|uniref:Alpha/beta hydrolase n=1 Tax=Paenibacillus thiaminolyticus TaxID=49283 RepID=A0AAP9J3A2_PANTH|nr:alpha/beta hydrolase [Paenibacillus thiaminolyticus]MCY9538858.1 alpha/beta hydrolase [Paenibacillus thiaminolyticus]MCY9600467.1 alpha/beta hydrolase [Paenibacillus thiaminolyticus]MCY9606414.1 alpha/beta hydrolase [Paenibacillus thiaminolyticus]MCY9611902.1 alpha/beta hydrolase [Paenibacillus thiaminolyticus]MCY9621955.1 alpha/beta hydrolase [Paenibacillus thiaminolyticus]